MKKQRFLFVLICLLMTFVILPFTAQAEDADVNSPQALIDAIVRTGNDNSAIRLTDNIDLTEFESAPEYIILGSDNVTFDLAGYTLKTSRNFRIVINEGRSLTVKNGTIEGNGESDREIFEFNNGSLTLEKITVQNNHACVVNMAQTESNILTINNSTFNNNGNNGEEGSPGSAIVSKVGSVEITNSVFSGNKAKEYGGAIRKENGSLTINGSKFTNNAAGVNGGAIWGNGTSITLNNGTEITNNTAAKNGGGLNIDKCTLIVNEGVSISNNKAADEDGGGIRAVGEKTSITIKGGTIGKNTSGRDGGGVYVNWEGSQMTITGGAITQNECSGYGGGVYINGGSSKLDMSGGTIGKNKSNGEGGGVWGWNSDITITGPARIDGNTSGDTGGGVYAGCAFDQNYTLTIRDAVISNNTTEKQGGGIGIKGNVTAIMESGTISGNTANDRNFYPDSPDDHPWNTGGGGVYSTDETVFIFKNGTIENNLSEGSGGGIFAGGSIFEMTGGIVQNNIAVHHEGGGISITDGAAAKITKGKIINNLTGYYDATSPNTDYFDWGGGGIFVADQSDAVLIMPVNTLVTGNEAGGFGGGVAACSTGRSYVLDHIAIFGNTAAGKNISGSGSAKDADHQYAYDNPVFMANGFQDYYSAFVSYVTNKMPGGNEKWKGSSDGEPAEIEGEEDIIISTSTIGLSARGESSWGEDQFDVVITGNKSYTHGGGILNNGTIVYGEAESIYIGRPLALEASKALLDANDNNISSQLEVLEDQTIFKIIDENEQVLSQGKVVCDQSSEDDESSEDEINSCQIVFDRRITFDSNNCIGDGDNGWDFTYYVLENSGPEWMEIDSSIYKLELHINRDEEKITIPDPVGGQTSTITKYNYSIDFDQSKVQISKDGGETWEAFAYTHDSGDEAHGAVLSLWPEGKDETTFFSFTNKTVTIEIPVTKVWDDADDQDGTRPESILVTLLADGKAVDTHTLTAPWEYTFTGLPKYKDGVEIQYTISEDTIPNYESSINGYVITNTYKNVPETIDIPVTKVWRDSDDSDKLRPESILVTLLADGKEFDTHTLTAPDWAYTFTGLPKYKDSVEIVYTITEDKTDGYVTTIDGYTIINSHTPEPHHDEPPEFFHIDHDELPKTGLTGSASAQLPQPASVNYQPLFLTLMLPTFDLSMDVVEVRAENGEYPVAWLGENAGLLEGTDYPGEGISVLVGHNTLNQEEYGPFVRIRMLSAGDRFFILNAENDLLVYEVYANEKIDADGVQQLYEAASRYPSTVTLLTCEDELAEGGYASRRIVAARQLP